jgi:cell division septal protein FtsQ
VRRKRELVIGVSVIVIATLAFIFGWTNLFTVKSISVAGSPNSQITKQVLLIADIQKGEKLARVEPRNIASKLALAGIDWIENVKISRNWINRNVTINLSARVAIGKSGDQYVDKGGVLFTSPVQVNGAILEINAKDDTARAAAVGLYSALPTELREKLATLTASSENNFQFTLKNDLKINWGGNSNTAVKVKIYKALIALPENKKIRLMDVSDPTKPTVK